MQAVQHSLLPQKSEKFKFFEDRLLLFKDQRDRISWEDKECHFLVFFWHKKKNVELLVLVQ